MRERRDRPGFGRLFGRALKRHCPVCGRSDMFTGYFRMADSCPHCGYRFVREEGYWVGAMVVNTAVTEGIFAVAFITVLIVTWPDVTWAPLLIAGLSINIIVPIFFYPYSRTIWMALDLYFHPPDDTRAAREGDRM